MTTTENPVTFQDLGLSEEIMRAIAATGYETPSPIQAEIIPHVIAGKDVLGQAQTGTGKTAAFALPVLSTLDLQQSKLPQVLVLAPTRELAIQVSEAFQKYASHLPNFHVLPIYGGESYTGQLKALSRGVHVVVGTPGRVMDHIRRGTLRLDAIKTLILDEADEMLRMGFIDDVEWVLEQMPKTRQIALFSATMPREIKSITERYLNDPEVVVIKQATATATTINQRYWVVSGHHKLDVLTRILEAEDYDGIIVFVRTKTATVELAEKLAARGYAATALNGDIPQANRERIVDQLKSGKFDILVATDVVARGLDVKRISHVINYDIPHDTEGYVHRIGRTGRAGRSGEAILFVAPREQRLLAAIERATRQKIELLKLPTIELINNKRITEFKQRITDEIASKDLSFFYEIMEQYKRENDISSLNLASALASLLQGDQPLLLDEKEIPKARLETPSDRGDRGRGRSNDRRGGGGGAGAGGRPRRSNSEGGGSRNERSGGSFNKAGSGKPGRPGSAGKPSGKPRSDRSSDRKSTPLGGGKPPRKKF
ncbi:MAG: DEAD/DEAH box helicase [Zetaproteobacteria bacterium]|nr:DEAD/DEAH box helicase [Zetaproteobacteria bacterium]